MTNKARKTEATSDSVEVPWRGHVFTVATSYDDWTVDLIESLEEGKTAGIVRGSLGPEQWQAFKMTNPKARDLNDLANAITTALGFRSQGESQASSD